MTQFFSAAGTSLHYELRGEGPLLVCQPGGPARPASYLDTLGGLERHRTLLLLDPRGVGGSDPAEDYGFAALAEDLEALRLHLGVDGFDLLGHSAGALPAVLHAARRPGRVRRLVLLTPTRRPIPPQDGEPGRAALARELFDGEPWLDGALAALEKAPTASDDEFPSLARQFTPVFYGRWDAAAQAHAFRPDDCDSAPEAAAGFGASPFDPASLSAITAPVTVLAGDRDVSVGLAAPAVWASWLPGATLEWLPGCGHFPWLENPAGVSRAILTALGTPSDPDASAM
ncbi:pimeloyl-ACP methyl ester carboxylesterase [Streptosporangium album]|uniref:Pimeloyl-ACP methyl ester carboxylesterase n=1 Tax=Streptosporangium album TaxID=47479 RepID=A0A7W7RV38_9ACTN|nr:alpha/beta hydrolase [Streptosporangium album]MBB4938808.1 pimeloyl-ACP methyl ester carboxylesterase [Streptosporangium album]